MNEHQVTLLSTVQSNPRNSPSAFETRLASPLFLPGTWGVSIMDITYPHRWTRIIKDIHYAIMFPSDQCVPEYAKEVILASEQPITATENFILSGRPERGSPGELNLFEDAGDINFNDKQCKYRVKIGTFSTGEQLDASSMVKHMDESLKSLYRLRFGDTSETAGEFISYDTIDHEVEFRNLMGSRYLIVAPIESSIIQMLGYSSRASLIRCKSGRLVEVMAVEHRNIALAKARRRRPLLQTRKVDLRKLENVFVYSDIVKSSLVGDSQSNFLGYFPIKSTYEQTGYWCFNPPYYHEVQHQTIETIAIKLCTEEGELFPNKDGKVIVRLHFRRIL